MAAFTTVGPFNANVIDEGASDVRTLATFESEREARSRIALETVKALREGRGDRYSMHDTGSGYIYKMYDSSDNTSYDGDFA